MAPEGRRQQRRPPRLAESVADVLRERILNGTYEDGGLLPKQEELVDEFMVSLPSVREGLRTLENEGLITVVRGNVGGSVVHLPQVAKVGYMLGLVLQSRDTDIDDIVYAITQLQPLCARACALRKDRRKAVVPRLRAIADQTEAAIDDADEFARLARLFHEEVVARCGNETFIVMIGALEKLWTAQVHGMTKDAGLGAFAQRATRERSVREHRQLIACILAGDSAGAEEVARQHQAEPGRHGLMGTSRKVDAHYLHT